LTNGNDAGNLDINNIGNLTVNKYLTIGNQVSNTSQLHMCFDTGNTTAGKNWQMVASNQQTPQIDFQLYNNNSLVSTPLTIKQNLISSTTGIVSTGGIAAKSFGVSDGVGNDGLVFDSLVNFPNVLMASSVNNISTKIYPANSAKSILQFNSAIYNEMLNNFTMYFKTLSFQFDVTGGSNLSPLTVQLFLSDTLDGDFDGSNPLNVSWTSGNVSLTTGGNPNVNTGKVILSMISTPPPLVDGIYLNVKTLSTDNNNTFQLQSMSFISQLTASFMAYKTYTPVIMT
jgi:hypothetical protein